MENKSNSPIHLDLSTAPPKYALHLLAYVVVDIAISIAIIYRCFFILYIYEMRKVKHRKRYALTENISTSLNAIGHHFLSSSNVGVFLLSYAEYKNAIQFIHSSNM